MHWQAGTSCAADGRYDGADVQTQQTCNQLSATENQVLVSSGTPFESMSMRELRQECKIWAVDISRCSEKVDIISQLRRRVEYKAQGMPNQSIGPEMVTEATYGNASQGAAPADMSLCEVPPNAAA